MWAVCKRLTILQRQLERHGALWFHGASWTRSPVDAKGRLRFARVMKHYFSFDIFPSVRNEEALLCMQAIQTPAEPRGDSTSHPLGRLLSKTQPVNVDEDVETLDPRHCWWG